MFDLTRRKLLIGALISGTAISAPSLTFAEDRYQVLVELQHDTVRAFGVYKEMMTQNISGARSNFYSPYSKACSETSGFNKSADALLDYLLREFNRSDLTSSEVLYKVRAVLNRTIPLDTMDADELRRIEDVAVSLAVVKNLFKQNMPIDVHSQAFHTFATVHRPIFVAI